MSPSGYESEGVTNIYYTHRFLYAQEKPSRTIYLARLIFYGSLLT